MCTPILYLLHKHCHINVKGDWVIQKIKKYQSNVLQRCDKEEMVIFVSLHYRILRDMILENMRLRIIKNCKGILKLSHNNNFGIRQHSYNPFESDLYDTQHMPHT